jgi:DNA polymerase-3 subunit alpha
MAIMTLSDASGSYEVIAFSEQLEQFRDVLQVGKLVILTVEADDRADGVGLRLIGADLIEKAAEKVGRRLEVEAASAGCLSGIKERLRAGDGEVILVVRRDAGAKRYDIELPGRFRISPELAEGIKALDGVVGVELS